MSTVTGRHRPHTTLVFQPGGAEVVVALRQVTDARRIGALGLTDAQAVIEGRLVRPLELPASVKAGAQAVLVWAGRAGAARLEPVQDSLTPRLRQRFGQRITLSWRTDEIP